MLQLEAEVVALRRSILQQPPTAPSHMSENARIDQMLTSHLGPRDPYFAHPKQSQPLPQVPPQRGSSGRVGLPPEWLAQVDSLAGQSSSAEQERANDAAAMLSSVRSQISQLRGELGALTDGTLT